MILPAFIHAKPNPVDYRFCKAESCFLSFMQSRILLSFIHTKPNPVDYRFCKAESCFLSFMQSRILRTFVAGDLCPAAFIFYISVYFTLCSFGSGLRRERKIRGVFVRGIGRTEICGRIRKTKRAPKGSCLLICCASELDILHRYGMPAGDSSTATSWHTVISA